MGGTIQRRVRNSPATFSTDVTFWAPPTYPIERRDDNDASEDMLKRTAVRRQNKTTSPGETPMFRRTFLKSALGVALLFVLSQLMIAQDPSPTPSEEELRLQEQNRLLKLKKENATLKNDIREAILSPTSTPLPGTVELTKVTMEPQMMSYSAMSTACHCIATKINSTAGDAQLIVIYDSTAVAGLKHYRLSYPIAAERLDGITKRMEEETKPANAIDGNPALAVGAGLSFAEDVLKSFADVLAMFRGDTEIDGVDVTINAKALTAEMLSALNERYGPAIILYDPGSFSPDEAAAKENGNFKSQILKSLLKGYRARNTLLQMIAAIHKVTNAGEVAINNFEAEIAGLKKEIAKLEAELKKAKSKKEKGEKEVAIENAKADIDAKMKSIEDAKEAIAKSKARQVRLNELLKEFDSLMTELTTISEKTGTNDLLTFLKAESLELVLSEAGTNYYWLDIASVSAGGNNRTRKNLLTFFGGSKIDHSGGIVLEWQLLNPKWRFIDGGKTQVYEGYLGSKEIRKNRGVTFPPKDPNKVDVYLAKTCGYRPKGDDDAHLAAGKKVKTSQN